MAYNTILIKRRPFSSGVPGAPTPGSLTVGELAFNEVNSTLYFESSLGTLAIAGSGSFVDRTTDQTIGGNKTFTGSTTLSTTTWSAGSTLDFGGNVLGNIGAPVLSADAATKEYVDALSALISNTFVKLTEERPVIFLSGLDVTDGLTTDTLAVTADASVGGNLTVTGNLSVLGTQTVINTETINISGTSTQIDVVNNGTGTGITVNQTGSQNIAEFYDDANIALAIVDGGNVGIGTLTPSEKLTIAGNVSASGNVTAVNGDFSGTLTVSSSVSAAGALTVDGATTLTNTLDVLNAATFSSTVSAQGALSIDGTSTLTGNVSAGADIIGVAGSSLLVDFIIDGGMF